MSTVKAKNHQIGSDGTASNNFTIYQPSTPDGTIRIGQGVSGATTKDMVTINGTNITLGGNLVQASTAAPAFSAYQSSAQTLSSLTNTKILFQIEEFDTNSNFASSTFTPTVAGYYQVSASIRTSSTLIRMMIWKNGSMYKIGTESTASNALVSTLVYCNGTTDYIETYALLSTGQALAAGSSVETWFNGAMVRSA